jgi:hypothetical protein
MKWILCLIFVLTLASISFAQEIQYAKPGELQYSVQQTTVSHQGAVRVRGGVRQVYQMNCSNNSCSPGWANESASVQCSTNSVQYSANSGGGGRLVGFFGKLIGVERRQARRETRASRGSGGCG